jgi:lipopolysaccharide transport system ATP-binding protein
LNAIEVNNISKMFKIPQERTYTLFQKMVGMIKGRLNYEKLWALNDISFNVNDGETFGIIGRNGSGKTTLLKILARVLYADTGSLSINGSVASFLELGVGFQPEITARENVYLYSSILGISKKEVDKNYDTIFDFAELKRFQNLQLNKFSSGMQLRLAFSTAIFARPDILLIDEVFAVGDESFQKKCVAKIKEIQQRGKSIVFVTHDLRKASEFCQRLMLLDGGRSICVDKPEKVIEQYEEIQ